MRRSVLVFLFAVLCGIAVPDVALAAEGGIDSGDTAWVLVSSALVLLMTPGLALFYGGMVRRKNVLSTIMYSLSIICVVSVQWVIVGYSLAFGPDKGGLIGDLSLLGLQGVGLEPNLIYAPTIPHQAFMVFQLMFAIITAALISGSFVERMRFPAFLIFVILWTTFVYDPLAHWVWGDGGWLRQLGALDFAGGTVVHISSGVSGLIIALILGKRLGMDAEPALPHNLPLTVLGAGMLWFGWFGFNGGSALTANGLAASAIVVTNTAAAAGALGWLLAEWLLRGKPTVLGTVSGGVAGLVAITPAAGFVQPLPAIIIGVVAGTICYLAVGVVKARFGYDDALDAFGIHGVGGIWGALATGLFASQKVNPAGANGLLFGNPHQLLIQAEAVVATLVFVSVSTFIICRLVDVITPIRASLEEETLGLDLLMHGERAYDHIF